MREEVDIGEDRHLRSGCLATRCACHPAQDPLVGATRTQKLPRTRQQCLACLREHRELRQPAALWAMPVICVVLAKCRGEIGQRLEHWCGARARQERIGPALVLTGEPSLDDAL